MALAASRAELHAEADAEASGSRHKRQLKGLGSRSQGFICWRRMGGGVSVTRDCADGGRSVRQCNVCDDIIIIVLLHSKSQSRDTPTWVREDDAKGLGRITRLQGMSPVSATWIAKAVSPTASATILNLCNPTAKGKCDIKRSKCTISFPCSDTPHWPWLPQL